MFGCSVGIGRFALLHRSPLVVDKALNGVKPHLMVTDPPYGVEYDAAWRGHVRTANGKRLSLGVHAKGKVENDGKADWREAWVLFPGDVAYVWHAAMRVGESKESLEEAGFALRAQIIWAKNNFAISRGHYHFQHEPAGMRSARVPRDTGAAVTSKRACGTSTNRKNPKPATARKSPSSA